MVQKWIEGRRSAGSLSGGYNVSMREQVLACTILDETRRSVELIAARPGLPSGWTRRQGVGVGVGEGVRREMAV